MTRRRYTYTEQGQPLPEPVEVPADWIGHGRYVGRLSDLFMDGDTAPDGTDIGSRQKRREWMRAAGVADVSDYTEAWAKAHAKRVRAHSLTEHHDPTTRDDVAQTIADLRRRGRR